MGSPFVFDSCMVVLAVLQAEARAFPTDTTDTILCGTAAYRRNYRNYSLSSNPLVTR